MYLQRIFEKGDFVFASTLGYPPYPAVITFRDQRRGYYKVKFINYRATATVSAEMVEQFNQQTIQKYQKMYKNSCDKQQKAILRKIKQTKTKFSVKNKKKDKKHQVFSFYNNSSSSTKSLKIHQNDSQCCKEQFIHQDHCNYTKQQVKKSPLQNGNKAQELNNKIMQVVSKICMQGPPYSNGLSNVQEHLNAAQFKELINKFEQDSPANKALTHNCQKLINNQEKIYVTSQSSSEIQSLFINKLQSQPLTLGKQIDQDQSWLHAIKQKPLNLCQDIDLQNPDCSYDQMQIEEGDHRKFLQKMRYRRIKIGIYIPRRNIDRINNYMDILLDYFEKVKVDAQCRCGLSIKMKQYIIAIFEHKYIKPQHYLKHSNTVGKMVHFLSQYYHAADQVKNKLQTEYFNIKIKLNILYTAFRFNGNGFNIEHQQWQQLKAAFGRFKQLQIKIQ